MRKLKHVKYHRQRNRLKTRAITLTLEPLEPRLVLSAAEFGFEAARGHLDAHHRHHGDHEPNRPAFAEQFHSKQGDQRLEFENRSVSELPISKRDGQPRADRPHKPFSANSTEPGRHGSRLHDHSGKPRVNFGGAEGESTAASDQIQQLSPAEFVPIVSAPNLPAETTIPSTVAVLLVRPPTDSPTRGDDSLNFGQPTSRPSQPTLTVSDEPVSQQSDSAAALPISVPVSLQASSRSARITPTLESPSVSFDAVSSDNDAVSVQPAGESASMALSGVESFVSFAGNELPSWWNVDGESFDAAVSGTNPLPESIRRLTVVGQTSGSSTAATENRRDRLSEELLWAGFSTGGFIEIETDTDDDAPENIDIAKDADDPSSSKRLSTPTPRNAYWFDFGDLRLDLMCDSFDADEGLVEEQALDDADDTDEQAWLLDDGGLIVLTSSQFIDHGEESGLDDSGESSPSRQTASATEIPMDAGIDVFQAIEVAAAPVQQPAPLSSPDTTPALPEGEADAAADQVLPAAESAAERGDSGTSEPVRAASIPLLVAFSALMSHGRKRRTDLNHQKRDA